MKTTLLAKMSRTQLRAVVGQIVTITTKELEKMSSEKCLKIIYAHDLTYNQLKSLTPKPDVKKI